MSEKNIRIEVWTDLFYARFIAKWFPDEAAGTTSPELDTRTDEQKNVPYLLVTNSIFEGRPEVAGDNAILTTQHPMPAEFLKQQTRHIAYMFANEFGIFKPSTKAAANTFLAKMSVGFTKVKEMDVKVSPSQGTMTLRDLRDALANFTDEQLKTIKVPIIGENPSDALAKGLSSSIHTIGDSKTQQYITVTKLLNVYDVADPYIRDSMLPTREEMLDNYKTMTPGPVAEKSMQTTVDAIAADEADLQTLKTIDQLEKEKIENSTMAQNAPQPKPTLVDIQKVVIAKLQQGQ